MMTGAVSAVLSLGAKLAPPPVDPREERRGERGAIMVMGVFLACSMIAAMWYLMGIGDAILWRDRQQEAADSIAFTSAAVHARGMNFISMINIIMLLVVAVYLIACILRTALDLILYVTGDDTDIYCEPFIDLKYTKGHGGISGVSVITGFFTGSGNVPRYGDAKCGGTDTLSGVLQGISSIAENLGDNSAGRDLAIACASCGTLCVTVVCPIAKCIASHPMHDIADKVGKLYDLVEKFITYYEKGMRYVMPALHTAEVWTAALSPWLGMVAGTYEGLKYKDGPSQEPATKISHKGIAISPSMFRHLKKPTQAKVLKDNLNWIKCANQQGCGNGCGPTLCNDGMVSRSGPRKQGTGGTTAECCGSASDPGCTNQGTCNGHGQPAADQSGLYETKTIDDQHDYRIGLPVQAENMNELCQKAFSYLGDAIQGLVTGVTGGFNASSNGSYGPKNKNGGSNTYSTGGLISQIFDAAGGWFKKAYCTYDPAFSADHSTDGSYEDVFPGQNGHYDGGCSAVCQGDCPDKANDFWAINDTDKCPWKGWHTIPLLLSDGDHGGGNGPMKVVDYAPNGGDYNQVYGVVMNDKYNPLTPEYGSANTQTAWSKLKLAVGPAQWDNALDQSNGVCSLTGQDGNGPWFYLSEAEFYHDCESDWNDNDCNGGDHATYRLNWRTRLRRVHKPIYIQELTQKIPSWVGQVGSFLTNNQFAINQFTTNNWGVDLGCIFTLVETLTGLAGQGSLIQTPPLVH